MQARLGVNMILFCICVNSLFAWLIIVCYMLTLKHFDCNVLDCPSVYIAMIHKETFWLQCFRMAHFVHFNQTLGKNLIAMFSIGLLCELQSNIRKPFDCNVFNWPCCAHCTCASLAEPTRRKQPLLPMNICFCNIMSFAGLKPFPCLY